MIRLYKTQHTIEQTVAIYWKCRGGFSSWNQGKLYNFKIWKSYSAQSYIQLLDVAGIYGSDRKIKCMLDPLALKISKELFQL